MTKLIAAFIIIGVCYCGYLGFLYWEKIKNEEETQKQEAAAALNPAALSGMPPPLEKSYQQAQQRGNAAMRAWLKTYGPAVQDPRRAWIEMDFCVAIARDDPAEARRIFASVKQRTPPSSPVWPRVKQLEKAYE